MLDFNRQEMVDLPNSLKSILDGKYFDPELRLRLFEWQEDPFRRFLQQNETKVASKFSNLYDPEDQRDVGLELFVARMFTVAGCQVVYEPIGRRTDFQITKGSDSFYCEARRIRENLSQPNDQPEVFDFPPNLFYKLGDVLCDKFLQLEPNSPNVIYIRSNRFLLQKIDFQDAIKSLAELARDHQSLFFRRRGFKDESHFLEKVSLCSAVVFHHFWTGQDESDDPFVVSLNANASFPISENIIHLLHSAARLRFKAQMTINSK